jgi:hypothetical protein
VMYIASKLLAIMLLSVMEEEICVDIVGVS